MVQIWKQNQKETDGNDYFEKQNNEWSLVSENIWSKTLL